MHRFFLRQTLFFFLILNYSVFSHSVRTPNYPYIRYTVDTGLPQSIVSALMQDSFGFLWIGTNERLARFNGSFFDVFSKGTGYPFGLITGIIEKKPGTIWISTVDDGIWELKQEKFKKIKIDSLKSNHINFLSKTIDNEILIGAEPGGLYVLKHDSLIVHINDTTGQCDGPIISAAKDYQGRYWLGSFQNGLQVFSHSQKILHLTTKQGLPSNEIRALLPLPDGTVWVGTRYGLFVYGNPKLTQELQTRFPGTFIAGLYSRNGRDVWVNLASKPGGVLHFRDDRLLETLHANEGFYSKSTLITESGALFLGSYQGLVVHPNRNFQNYGKERGLFDTYVRAITRGPDGNIWVATKNEGLYKLVNDHFIKPALNDTIFAGNSIFCIKTINHHLWIGTARGLYVFDGQNILSTNISQMLKNIAIRRIEKIDDQFFLLSNKNIFVYEKNRLSDYSLNLNDRNRLSLWGIGKDKLGQLVVGTNGQGAFLLKDKQWLPMTIPDSVKQIFSIRPDEDRLLYFATARGIYKWDGKTFTKVIDLKRTIWDVLPIGGQIWALTSNGLYHIKGGRVRIYNRNNGFISTEFNMGAVFALNENECWFGGVGGLVHYHKMETYPDFIPKFYITRLTTKDSLFTYPFSYSITLPFSNNSLRFYFQKINYGNEPFFKMAYYLKGFAKDTVFLNDEEINFVDYSYLPDGHYTFRLFLINPFTNEIAAQRSVSFTILAPWFKSPLFIFVMILISIGLVMAIVHARESYLKKRNLILEQQIQERTEDIRQSYQLLKKETEQRKKAQISLRNERRQLEITLKAIADGVIRTDLEGKILLINERAEVLLGISKEQASKYNLNEIVQLKEDGTHEIIQLPDYVKKWEDNPDAPRHFTALLELNHEQSPRFLNISWSKIREENGEESGYVWVFRDISVERQLEEEILKSQKLESIGLLAGGIAHDFNNILAGILGNTQLAELHISDPEQLKRYLKGIEEATLSASRLTKQLLTFAKGGEPVKEVISIKDILEETVEFALRGSNVSAHFEIDPQLWPIEADKGQLNQVINNLVINAMQAMPGGGTLSLKARNCSGEELKKVIPDLEGEYFIRIDISDTGIGIPKENLAKIFDPYFTTKQRGSGLGLATTYAIVKKHGGMITVESELGKGTTFSIFLPANPEAAVSKEKEAEEIQSFQNKRILVMDDEEYILELMGSFLEMLGIEADFAKEGREAIEKYRAQLEQGKPYDAVIMDLTIRGGMGGSEAVVEILNIDPQAKVIVASGYSTDSSLANYKQLGFVGRLSKPFTLEELNKILAEVLNTSGSGSS